MRQFLLSQFELKIDIVATKVLLEQLTKILLSLANS